MGSDLARSILSGQNPTGDRSLALTAAAREWYGWENWCRENNIAYRDDAETLAYTAGSALGIDANRVARILKTINASECHPAAQHRGGEESCWLKIRRLDIAAFEAKCPAALKAKLTSFSEEGSSKTRNPTGNLDPDERLKLDIQLLAGEDDSLKYKRRRAEICRRSRLTKAEVDEEVLRVSGKVSTPKAKRSSTQNFLIMVNFYVRF